MLLRTHLLSSLRKKPRVSHPAGRISRCAESKPTKSPHKADGLSPSKSPVAGEIEPLRHGFVHMPLSRRSVLHTEKRAVMLPAQFVTRCVTDLERTAFQILDALNPQSSADDRTPEPSQPGGRTEGRASPSLNPSRWQDSRRRLWNSACRCSHVRFFCGGKQRSSEPPFPQLRHETES